MVNVGNLPLHVKSVSIGGWKWYGSRACGYHLTFADELPISSGYGFTVNNCSEFTLQPQESINLSISYHPDFSTSLERRELSLFTSQVRLRPKQ